jgi:acetyl esterase/lipase
MVQHAPAPPADPRVAIENRTVPGPAGAPAVPVRVYRPLHATDVSPGVVYFHGGAFVVGDLETEHANCLHYCGELACVVVSVDYRLAPEHPFPAGAEDCYAALCWTVEHAHDLGLDAARVAVGGSSAGGGLAAAVALMARDREGPALCFQLLVYPVLDDRGITPSSAFQDVPVFNGQAAEWMWRHYVGEDAADVSPYAAPARALDVSRLPAAYVLTCELDPLRDEGIDYAVRMARAGVPVELHHFAGTFHGFDGIAPDTAVGRRAVHDRTEALRAGLRAGA